MTHSLEDLKTRLDVSLLDMLSILRLSFHLLFTDNHEGCFFLLSLIGEGINSEIKQFKQFARYGGTLVIPALGKLRQDFKFQVTETTATTTKTTKKTKKMTKTMMKKNHKNKSRQLPHTSPYCVTKTETVTIHSSCSPSSQLPFT